MRYWKSENVEVQREFSTDFQAYPPTRLKIIRIKPEDKEHQRASSSTQQYWEAIAKKIAR